MTHASKRAEILKPVDADARTIAESTYRRLRADIIWGILRPNTPLRSSALRIAYDVGISPLREALSRLVSEHLVTSIGQRGFRVAQLTIADVTDTLETRILLESDALQRSIRNGGLEWETAIVGSLHTMSRTAVPRGPGPQAEVWSNAHRAYHSALIGACGSPWLTNLTALLYDQAERHRIAAVIFAGSAAMRDRPPEHDEIAHAAIKRQPAKAVAALVRHYRRTASDVVAALERNAVRKAG